MFKIILDNMQTYTMIEWSAFWSAGSYIFQIVFYFLSALALYRWVVAPVKQFLLKIKEPPNGYIQIRGKKVILDGIVDLVRCESGILMGKIALFAHGHFQVIEDDSIESERILQEWCEKTGVHPDYKRIKITNEKGAFIYTKPLL